MRLVFLLTFVVASPVGASSVFIEAVEPPLLQIRLRAELQAAGHVLSNAPSTVNVRIRLLGDALFFLDVENRLRAMTVTREISIPDDDASKRFAEVALAVVELVHATESQIPAPLQRLLPVLAPKRRWALALSFQVGAIATFASWAQADLTMSYGSDQWRVFLSGAAPLAVQQRRTALGVTSLYAASALAGAQYSRGQRLRWFAELGAGTLILFGSGEPFSPQVAIGRSDSTALAVLRIRSGLSLELVDRLMSVFSLGVGTFWPTPTFQNEGSRTAVPPVWVEGRLGMGFRF